MNANPTGPALDPTADRLFALLGSDARESVPIAALAETLDVEPSAVLTALADLMTLGLAEAWGNDPDGPSAVLTPLGRARTGRRMPDEADWEPPSSWSHRRGVDVHEHAEALPDPRAVEPPVALGHAERAEALHRRSKARHYERYAPDALPWPRRLLGTDWPNPWPSVEPGKPCSVCLGRRLDAEEYCLACGGWGLDAAIPDTIRRQVQASIARQNPAAEGPRLAGGVGALALPGRAG